jgi:Rieske Fe-S protein
VLVVGGAGHKLGDEGDTRRRYQELEEWAVAELGATEVLHRWLAHDLVPTDGVPYIGRLSPGAERRWVATGFQKWGFSTAMVAAVIIRDGIAGKDNTWAPLFDATRVAPAVTRDLVKNGMGVVKHLVGDRIAAALQRTRTEIDALDRGEGTVVRIEGSPVGVARDLDGELCAVSATCTHQGCLVAFDRADLSWDCPCHGSRFDLRGEVLQGPASEPLAPVALGVPFDGAG